MSKGSIDCPVGRGHRRDNEQETTGAMQDLPEPLERPEVLLDVLEHIDADDRIDPAIGGEFGSAVFDAPGAAFETGNAGKVARLSST